jgi:mono/diheme cytochrome c family protein
MSVVGRGLPSLIVVVVALTGASARAQDLDHDKSGAKLFATTCADCHRSARGLAKGRFSWTLSYFLRQHYTSSAASAQSLADYLQSVDIPRAKPQVAARKSQPPQPPAKSASAPALFSPGLNASEPLIRPPASVPGR